LAEALESRAFGVTKDRESLVELRMKLSDYATVIIALTVLAIGIYVWLLFPLPSLDTGIKMPALWKF
jgi:energy-coupling factor transporter transmembrane protein EcfT